MKKDIRKLNKILIECIVIFTLIFCISSCAKKDSEEKQKEEQKAEEKQQGETKAKKPEKKQEKEQQQKVLDFELPKPVFVGTPQNFKVPDLEKPRQEPRADFYVPSDVELISLNKPVLSSDEAPIIGELEMVTDGEKKGAEGYYVELGPFLQHVTLDLGQKYEIYAIVVWHYHLQPRVYYDVIVQTANDMDMTENVNTLFNNDRDNSAGMGIGEDLHYVETAEGKLIDAKGTVGRFVRFYSNGNTQNDLNHYTEVSIYGRKVD